jgi:radical SAM superfamily enzyme YgiQ (UPF0313 family)
VTADRPHILLVNPWIDDFAAYDVWAQPLGLLMLGGLLRRQGYRLSYLDCLDRFHPRAPRSEPFARQGRGPYIKTPQPAPAGLEDIPRRYSRYGIRTAWLHDDLSRQAPPDLILVTSMMTYWYPGVQATIAVLRQTYPAVPILLGGIYATLCREHAERTSGADHVIPGAMDARLLETISSLTGYGARATIDLDDVNAYPYPAWDLRRRINYVPILTSLGCPFDCAYCASRFLQPRCRRRHPQAVVEEILFWHKTSGVRDFVIYDDAFLMQPDAHAGPILEGLIRSGARLRFHTPNALHIRGIDRPMARLLARAGFHTLRLGLETTVRSEQEAYDHKVNLDEFVSAADNLRNAGFTAQTVGAYLLIGLPGQPMDAVVESIRLVKKQGIQPILAYYTPIPHTQLWPEAVAASRYDLEADPVFSNNAIFPCQPESFSWERLSELKKITRIAA